MVWDTYDATVRDLALVDLQAGRVPAATLTSFLDDDAALLVVGRSDGLRDGAAHVSEMATLLAAGPPRRAVFTVPGRLRHLDDDPAETITYTIVVTSVEHDESGWQLRARTMPYRADGEGWRFESPGDVEVELSPVASLVSDVVRHPSDVDLRETLSVLTAWGHTVCVPSSARGEGGAAEAIPGLRPPTGRARHRVHRLASELTRRHVPTGSAVEGFRRPAVVTRIPAGWEPACPI